MKRNMTLLLALALIGWISMSDSVLSNGKNGNGNGRDN